MTENSHCFVEWKEEFVSQERGKRVVHYFLKDSAGESILAIVGTERSLRHMFYVVSEDFVRAYGPEYSINPGFKWRSKREAVDWLTSILSNQRTQDSPKDDSAMESSECLASVLAAKHMQGHFPRNLNGHGSEITWSGDAWTCRKRLKHYPEFCRNGTTITSHSFVFIMGKGENRYLAYLEDMYEDKRKQKKIKLRWFHHNQEIEGVVPLRNAHPKEVFITPCSQVISAECIDGSAAVLIREHYEEILAAIPSALSTRIHFCFRQFKSNKVKPFDLRKLQGYYDQPILTLLKSKPFPMAEPISHNQLSLEDEESNPSESVKLGNGRTTRGRAETFLTHQSRVGISGDQTFKSSYLDFRNGFSGKRLLSLKHCDGQLSYAPLFKVDEKIELLCQDSGIRGCWFRCTVLQISREQIKVQYADLQDEDGCGNLKEWIPAFKLARTDGLNMRHQGRPTIRPAPPPNEVTDSTLEVGTAVDAWWSDGWWEGVVIGIAENDTLQVYFPGESFFLNVRKKDVRISKDWIGDRWMDIAPKPDILSAIAATISPKAKISISSLIIDDNKISSTLANDDKLKGVIASHIADHTSTNTSNTEGKMPDLAALKCPESFTEDMECDDDKSSQLSNSKDNEEGHGSKHAHGDKADGIPNSNNVNADCDINEVANRIDTEMLETSENNCESAELMELTA